MEDVVAYVDHLYRHCEENGVSLRENLAEAISLADVLRNLPPNEQERLLTLPEDARLAVLRSKTKARCSLRRSRCS